MMNKLLRGKLFMSMQVTVIVLTAMGAMAKTTAGYWNEAAAVSSRGLIAENKRNLTQFKLYELNVNSLKAALENAPDRSAAGDKTGNMISFPDAGGNYEDYRVFEMYNMEPALAAAFPEIKSYVGKGVDDPTAIIYFSVSPLGLQTMLIRGDKQAEFIEPYTTDRSTYAVYRKGDKSAGQGTFECKIINHVNDVIDPGTAANRPNADDGNFRTYRLALSVTGEYTAFFGGTKALALAGINNSMTRVNGVFEIDFGIHMNLIANDTVIIYTNASTDPYSNASSGAGGAWNQELQTNLTNVIGNANYDIGHLFGASGGGGNAGCIACVCVNPSVGAPLRKGSAFTSPADAIPQGDNFDIDYVAHEMGHQFGGNHTFTFSNEGSGKQMEPGSGSTIMGYAGITGSTDVQPHSDAYFHAISVEQITNYIKTTTCQTTTVTGNAIPTADAGLDYTIPRGTAFALTGVSTDANDAGLSYCWEQMNSGGPGTTFPSINNTTGAAFRSFTPISSPVHYFPRLSTIQAGATAWTWEAVPNVARTMNFRFTVRDNHAGGPANNSDDMIVTVSTASGPFVVTAPNTAVSWGGNSTQTVTWNVASTTAMPVSCANVKISLSTDGGNTFPTVILASTANDGSESITVPNVATTQARIKVEAVGNIFFDMSNTNFTITVGSGLTTITTSAISPTSYCPGAPVSVPFTTNGAANAGNVFTAQLSNGAGSFANPVTIGTLNSASAGTISAIIPAGTSADTAYRIRVVSSSPIVNGSNNGANLRVNAIPLCSITGNNSVCSGSSTQFCAPPGLASYLWNTGATTQCITVNAAGTYTVTVTNAGGCSSTCSKSLTENTPPSCAITGNTSVCQGNSTQFCAPAGLTTYLWNTAATTQCITVSNASIYSVTVTAANGCTSDCWSSLTVNQLPSVSFTGLATSYNVNAAGATLTGSPAGGNFSGPGISGNTFTPASAGVGGPYNITYAYTDGNGCGNSSVQQTTVTNCTVPARPGTITTTGGAAKVCPGDSKTYSVAVVAGATFYTWTAPAGGNITNGQGTRIVTINYTGNFIANDSLRVVAGNACGNGASRALLISRNVPPTPSAITGQTYGVCNLTGVPYSVTNVAGMTYTWSWSVASATIASGQGSNAVTADFSSAFKPTGMIRVTATNACATSAQKVLTVRAYPATPGSINGSNAVCVSQQGVPYSTSAIPFATNYTWSVPAGARINDGIVTSTGTTLVTAATSVTVNFATTSGNVKVRANNACGSGTYRSLAVSFVCRDGEQLFADDLSLNCFPMPASDQLNVIFYSNVAQPNSIRIIDLIGKTLLNNTNKSISGENKFVIDISTFASGIYMLEVINGNQKSLQKIVIE